METDLEKVFKSRAWWIPAGLVVSDHLKRSLKCLRAANLTLGFLRRYLWEISEDGRQYDRDDAEYTPKMDFSSWATFREEWREGWPSVLHWAWIERWGQPTVILTFYFQQCPAYTLIRVRREQHTEIADWIAEHEMIPFYLFVLDIIK